MATAGMWRCVRLNCNMCSKQRKRTKTALVGTCEECGRQHVKLVRSRLLKALLCRECYHLRYSYIQRQNERGKTFGKLAEIGMCEECGKQNVRLRRSRLFEEALCVSCYQKKYTYEIQNGKGKSVDVAVLSRELGRKYFPHLYDKAGRLMPMLKHPVIDILGQWARAKADYANRPGSEK